MTSDAGVCLGVCSPNEAYSGAAKKEQKMHLKLMCLRTNHHVYLNYCPAGRITNSCEPDTTLLESTAERFYSKSKEASIKGGMTNVCHF